MTTEHSKRRTLTLYTGEHCPLCEQAKQLLYPLLGDEWRLREINIASDIRLIEVYGKRIPVVVSANGEEKGWPFTSGQIKRLMGRAESA